MQGPVRRTRIVAGEPMVVGEQRLLPSVVVTTAAGGDSRRGMFSYMNVRPISIVVTGPEGTQWLEIPNVTVNALSRMAVIGLGVAGVSLVLIGLLHLVRNR